jgi:hypothetical protein
MNEVTQPERGKGTVFSALALVAALTGLLVLAPMASAASDPVASGTVNILMKKGFVKTLKKNGVKLQKASPGTLSGRTLAATIGLPVKEGEIDPTNGAATLTTEGGFKFKHGKKKAAVTGLVVTTSNSSMTGKVAGKKMKFASVVGYSFTRNGFGVNFSATKLKLTKNAAKQLNKKLGFTGKKKSKKNKRAHAAKKKKAKAPFKANQVFGNTSGETQPKTVAIVPGGKADLTTDLGTVGKFVLPPPEGFGVKIVPLPPGEASATLPPVLSFPISGGSIAPDASAGQVQTTGGVQLVQEPEEFAIPIPGKTTMTLNAIWVDLSAKSATVEVNVESTIDPQLSLGNLGRSSIADVSLAGATVTSDPAAHTVTVENASATLQAVTAEVLNQVFGAPWDAAEIPHPTFAAGDPLGKFTFTVQTQ